jgi:hypothetical protein
MRRPHAAAGKGSDQEMDLRHLRREARSALELAVASLAPTALIDRLAMAAGLLEALNELPSDSPPVIALVPSVVTRANGTLDDWQAWLDRNRGKRIPRS